MAFFEEQKNFSTVESAAECCRSARPLEREIAVVDLSMAVVAEMGGPCQLQCDIVLRSPKRRSEGGRVLIALKQEWHPRWHQSFDQCCASLQLGFCDQVSVRETARAPVSRELAQHGVKPIEDLH